MPPGPAGVRERDQRQKHDDADAVVEERFTGDLRLEALGRPQVVQQPHHRDRVGGRDQGAEDHGDDQRNGNAGEPEQPPCQPAHHQRRRQHADGRQHADRPLVPPQPAEIDVQRGGEQQEAEHPAHQRFVEVDVLQEADDRTLQRRRRRQRVDDDEGERAEERDGERPRRRRQAQEAVVQVSAHRGDAEEDGGRLEAVHGSTVK